MTRICKTCGGDGGNKRDNPPDGICPVCHGSGDVPDSYWWDADGTLHTEPKDDAL